MKKIKLIVAGLICFLRVSAQADLGINSLMSPSVVLNGSSGILFCDISNAGFTDITPGCATVTIAVPSGIAQITGINPSTNVVWVPTTIPLIFPRTSITFRNLGGIIPADLTNFTIELDVRGIAAGGPSTITTSVALTGAFTQPGCTGLGNLNTGNDNSNTSIRVLSTLGVNLSSFNVLGADCKAFLNWTSQQEVNSKEYQVEVSHDGRIFSKIGSINAAGNSNISRYYTYTDNSPSSGYNYYRLKMVGLDGNVSFSSVVTIKSKCESKTISLHPNPVTENSNLTVLLAGYDRNLKGELINLSGQVVRSYNLKNGTNVLRVEGIEQGTYMLRVTELTAGTAKSFKVVVIK